MWGIIILTICVTLLIIYSIFQLHKWYQEYIKNENTYTPSESFEFGLGDEHDPIVYKELDDYEQL